MSDTSAKPTAAPCNCQAPKPQFPQQVTGMYILARALKNVGIQNVYGLVGIPVTEAAYLIQGQGIRFVGLFGDYKKALTFAARLKQKRRIKL